MDPTPARSRTERGTRPQREEGDTVDPADIEQEAALAVLEGRDPQQAVIEFIRRERRWTSRTLPLMDWTRPATVQVDLAPGQRAYRRSHREQVAAARRAWRRKNRDKYAAQKRRWRARHPEKKRAENARYRSRVARRVT